MGESVESKGEEKKKSDAMPCNALLQYSAYPLLCEVSCRSPAYERGHAAGYLVSTACTLI